MKNILIIPDLSSTDTKAEELCNYVKEALHNDCNVMCFMPEDGIDDPEALKKQIMTSSWYVWYNNIDLIIGYRFGALLANTLAGYDRILVDPIFSVEESSYDFSEESVKAYEQSCHWIDYDDTDDKIKHTHCWVVDHTNYTERKAYHKMILERYRRTRAIHPADASLQSIITDYVVHVANKIADSSFIDECGVQYEDYGRTLVFADPRRLRDVKEYAVKDGCLTISAWAFHNADLERLVIPDTVKHLGAYCFSDMVHLKEVSIGADSLIIEIPEGCFSCCTSLERITFGRWASNIQAKAFAYSGIQRIELTDCLGHIASDAFEGCENVKVQMNSDALSSLLRHNNELQQRFSTALQRLEENNIDCEDFIYNNEETPNYENDREL